MKRLLAFVCVLVMVLSLVLASCGGGNETSAPASSSAQAGTESSANTGENSTPDVSEENPDTTSEDPYRDENGNYVNKNQVQFREDWKDREVFRVLVYSNKVQTTYFSEEIESMYETTDDKIREAVDMRNKEIEDKYGIAIKAVAVDDCCCATGRYFYCGCPCGNIAKKKISVLFD